VNLQPANPVPRFGLKLTSDRLLFCDPRGDCRDVFRQVTI
jgi:hypothetical protein